MSLAFPRIGSYPRVLAVAGIKLGGVVLVTALLVQLAGQALGQAVLPAPLASSGLVPTIQGAAVVGQHTKADLVATVVISAAVHSLMLLLVALVWGGIVGLGASYFVELRRWRAGWLAAVAVVAWVTPTFLLAAFAQELQAQIFNVTDLALSGGYGTASAGQAFWAGVVLGIRPASYSYRQAITNLESQATQDHVRTALANGLPWPIVVRHYIFRPTAASLVGVWLNSFRVMLGSLPIIEFFFGYPGLGRALLLSLGVSYPEQVGVFQPDLAVGFVVALAVFVVVCEGVAQLARQRLDPRLADSDAVSA